MADYNLTNLSPGGFEELIQALALKVIGPHVKIFGRGPDGGREATFEGTVANYPYQGSTWQGYGIIQAKFRQRPGDAKANGQWALGQLRSELQKFANLERNLRQPEYYIFATNVVLTPVQDTGSKDQMDTLFQEFKEQFPLKGYDIWDYDKICRYLDGFEDIRHAYEASITSGDVLAHIMKRLKLAEPNFDQVMTRFLQKEFQADLFANLEQAGHLPEDKIPLARVFIDLPVLDPEQMNQYRQNQRRTKKPTGFLTEILKVARERFGLQSSDADSGEQTPQRSDLKPEPNRFVLLGGPGQGKTTLGQHVCQLFRAAILKTRSAGGLSPEVRQTIGELEALAGQDKIGLPAVPRFPIRIILSDFATALEDKPAISLLSYIVAYISTKTDQPISAGDLRQWLIAYPWLIILDGLDEVPPASNRDRVLAAIGEFWVDAVGADVLVIATSRPQGYNNDFSKDYYHHRHLVPLMTDEALRYGKRLAEVRYGIDPDRKQKVISRLERAAKREATAYLMQTPLQVTILTTLVDRMGQLPQARWSLFKEYYNTIYQREIERSISASDILRDFRADIDAIHRQVGLLLQEASTQPGHTHARLATAEFAEVVKERLSAEGHEGASLETLTKKIVDAATFRLVLLVGMEAGEVRFEIRSLQEFMAAEALMEGDDQTIRENLRRIAPFSYWRNVFLFTAGKCFVERQHLRDTIHTICSELNDEPEDAVARTVLLGSQLALDLLEDGSARQQPKSVNILTRLALQLLKLPPSEHHLRLASLYTPDLDPVYRGEIEPQMERLKLAHRLGAWSVLMTLVYKKIPWAEVQVSRQEPQSDSEKFDLLQVASDNPAGFWLSEQWVEVIPRISPFVLDNRRGRRLTTIWEERHGWDIEWIKAVSDINMQYDRSDSTFDLKLSPSDADPDHWEMSLTLLMLDQPDRDSPLEKISYFSTMPDPMPDWLPFVAAAEFIERPTKLTLAHVLRQIAKRFSLPAIGHASEKMPWPLAACVFAVSNEEDLLRLADRVQAGELGDIADWRAAERRWYDQSVTLDDILYLTDDHWPFDRQIARAGFPFAGCIITSTVGPRNQPFVRQLIQIRDQHQGKGIRGELAYWITRLIRNWFSFGVSSEIIRVVLDFLSYDQLQDLITDTIEHTHSISAEIAKLLVLCWQNTRDERWIDLLDLVGQHINYYYGYQLKEAEEMSPALSKAVIQYPSRAGILRLLAFFIRKGGKPSLPARFLDLDNTVDPITMEAMVTINLFQDDLDEVQARQLARQAAKLTNDRPQANEFILEALRDRPAVLTKVVPFLLELYEQLPPEDWQTRNQIIQALDISLSYRVIVL